MPETTSPDNWKWPTGKTTTINGLTIIWPQGESWLMTDRKLTIHTGTKANQATKIGLFDLRAKSLGLIDDDGNKISVVTKNDAKSSIEKLDKVVNRVLTQQVYIGSWLQRFEYTDSNITTMNENVQGAESTIRDADMAKEMTAYTKYNVLTQSAQAMLAQANQSSSQVLSLLQ